MEKPGRPKALTTVAGTLPITTSYSLVVAHSEELSKISINNSTDRDLIFSLDGGVTDHLFVGASEAHIYDNIRVNGAIHVKAVSSSTTSGNMRLERFAAD